MDPIDPEIADVLNEEKTVEILKLRLLPLNGKENSKRQRGYYATVIAR
jgi:hypothetical protein